ncbi:MAG: tetratricopeptide repeat protein [Armatimonadetes bacterium]|nr:tetratricopeptide repeat protein [Armatimonadota bacterium]
MSHFGMTRNRHYEAGVEYLDHGQFDLAIQELQRVVDGTTIANEAERKLARFHLGEAHTALAEKHAQRQQFESAEKDLKHALSINPHYADLHYQLARVYYWTDRLQESTQEVTRALEINPTFAKALFLRGLLLYRKQDRQGALNLFRQASELELAYCGGDLEKAFELDSQGDYESALDAFARVGEMSVDEVGELIRLAREQLRLGNIPEAEKNLRDALATNPNYADVHHLMGQVWLAQEKYLKAVNEFKTALLINPQFVAAHISLGVACRAMGNEDAARAAFQRAVSIEPGNEEARAHLSKR